MAKQKVKKVGLKKLKPLPSLNTKRERIKKEQERRARRERKRRL